jgi:hypothetical protein
MKKKHYYKVLKSNLKSLIIEESTTVDINGKQEKVSVQYKVGEFVSPNIPGTQLMIFDTLQNAQGFCLPQNGQKVFLVEALNVRYKGICVHYIKQTLPYILKLKKNKKRYVNLIRKDIPFGTLFADKVKLIKEIA